MSTKPSSRKILAPCCPKSDCCHPVLRSPPQVLHVAARICLSRCQIEPNMHPVLFGSLAYIIRLCTHLLLVLPQERPQLSPEVLVTELGACIAHHVEVLRQEPVGVGKCT